METNDDHNSSEAGSLYLSGWRRDSARRLPLRQTGLSLGRDPSPWLAARAGHAQPGAVQSPVTMR
jgi:hypothetical protein